MSLDSATAAALAGGVVNIFCAVEIVHPARTIRLLDGAGHLTLPWGGGTIFYGQDANVGSLGAFEFPTESAGDSAPSMQVTILPATMSAGVALATASAQGAKASIWIGCYNPATGIVIGTPDLAFFGEIDTVNFARGGFGGGNTSLQFELISGFERFFDQDEGARLASSFHKSIWPGELGFDYMTTIIDQMPWGADGAKPSVLVTGGGATYTRGLRVIERDRY